MTFEELQRRLITNIRDRIRSGAISERGLSRLTGISQPHIHNVLKGKRTFSIELSDALLFFLKIDILDLIGPDDWIRKRSREQ